MRLRLLALAGTALIGLTGCVSNHASPKPEAVSPSATGTPSVDTDIRKILTAGGLNADSPSAPKGTHPAANQRTEVASPSPQQPPTQVAAAQPATNTPLDAKDNARGKKSRKQGRSTPVIATVTPTTPITAAPVTPVTAGPIAPVQPTTQNPPPFVVDPNAPLPPVSPNSPPETTVRLPTVAQSPNLIPQNAPRQATVSSNPVNFNFLNGVGPAAVVQQPQPQPQPAPIVAQQQPTFGSIVAGPDARAILQPLLNPNSLVVPPRGRSHQRVLSYSSSREHVRGRQRIEIALPPQPPSRPSEPAAPSGPSVRRF